MSKNDFKKLKEFIKGKKLENFEKCKDREELFAFLKSTFTVVSKYVSDATKFKKHPLIKEEIEQQKS